MTKIVDNFLQQEEEHDIHEAFAAGCYSHNKRTPTKTVDEPIDERKEKPVAETGVGRSEQEYAILEIW